MLQSNTRSKKKQMQLTNKTIVITGGTAGIGRQLVQLLAPANHLYVIGRSVAKLNDLQQKYPNVIAIHADLNDTTLLETKLAQLLKQVSKVDVLINNAAVQHTATYIDPNFQYQQIASEINVNFTAICQLTYLLLPTLMASESARIVNINSGLAIAPKAQSAIYCASKSALNSFSLSLRYQLEHTSVLVQQALLPLVDTAMTEGRGSGKLVAREAAQHIIRGIERGTLDNDIGKVKLLRLLMRFAPNMAYKLMKAS
ncbi:SDR family NAD(P)-dependent oxidoreductase [Motilimonas sp. 1_MG-2023]|uniref:SDR family oxidoreductase n=1 Tax=Motilimonas sp. 1_MG-2023 TaxID=3062672 RepID=UPI0026E305BB|nr:SDR family NAD(P)-dependent oxidoreductase [Motilimonas sp. 1_MG-2023]MDO6527112.1 SDR family NAD(P)-dependent oxidoreductase [Motilimonas sp. 1_MG-2023]